MRILVSGASGFIGRPLAAHFTQKGDEVVPLFHGMGADGQIAWRAKNGSLEDFDAVIHLAGEPLSFGRWSSQKKEKILQSRKEGTKALSDALAHLIRPPPVFVSASAVGYYGNRGDELLDEGSAPGKGFLPHVCREWEAATRSVNSRGTRTVHARFGMVLGLDGGALKKILPIYRLGLGGILSSGNQWISWIALFDLISALDYLLHKDSLHGPVNLVSPQPVRQKEFCQTLASLLHRPAFFQVPRWMLQILLGSAAGDLLLASARVVPQKLCSSGFHFRYPDLQSALKISLFH